MNVSMQDTYNLGWKIGAVLKGKARPEILNTYELERHSVALDLILKDREFANFYADGPGILSENYHNFRSRFQDFLSGVTVEYAPSILTTGLSGPSNLGPLSAGQPDNALTYHRFAKHVKLGRRLPSYKVINQAEAREIHVANLLESNGRWRVLVFAGDLRIEAQNEAVRALGSRLDELQRTFSSSNRPTDAAIEIITIHSSPRCAVQMLDMHAVYHPWSEEGGWDYWKIFTDDESITGVSHDAYGKYGIDRDQGCIIICRPDQHVSFVGSVTDDASVSEFFAKVLMSGGERTEIEN